MTTIIGGKLMQVDKSALRNVVRHTDAHNRVKEMDEMWKQHEKQKYSDKEYEKESERKHKSRKVYKTRLYSDSVDDVITTKSTKAGPWTRKLMEYEEKDPDRWGHSGYKELYPEDFDASEEPSVPKEQEEASIEDEEEDVKDEDIVERWKKGRFRPQVDSRRPLRGRGNQRFGRRRGRFGGLFHRSVADIRPHERKTDQIHRERQRSGSGENYRTRLPGRFDRQRSRSDSREHQKHRSKDQETIKDRTDMSHKELREIKGKHNQRRQSREGNVEAEVIKDESKESFSSDSHVKSQNRISEERQRDAPKKRWDQRTSNKEEGKEIMKEVKDAKARKVMARAAEKQTQLENVVKEIRGRWERDDSSDEEEDAAATEEAKMVDMFGRDISKRNEYKMKQKQIEPRISTLPFSDDRLARYKITVESTLKKGSASLSGTSIADEITGECANRDFETAKEEITARDNETRKSHGVSDDDHHHDHGNDDYNEDYKASEIKPDLKKKRRKKEKKKKAKRSSNRERSNRNDVLQHDDSIAGDLEVGSSKGIKKRDGYKEKDAYHKSVLEGYEEMLNNSNEEFDSAREEIDKIEAVALDGLNMESEMRERIKLKMKQRIEGTVMKKNILNPNRVSDGNESDQENLGERVFEKGMSDSLVIEKWRESDDVKRSFDTIRPRNDTRITKYGKQIVERKRDSESDSEDDGRRKPEGVREKRKETKGRHWRESGAASKKERQRVEPSDDSGSSLEDKRGKERRSRKANVEVNYRNLMDKTEDSRSDGRKVNRKDHYSLIVGSEEGTRREKGKFRECARHSDSSSETEEKIGDGKRVRNSTKLDTRSDSDNSSEDDRARKITKARTKGRNDSADSGKKETKYRKRRLRGRSNSESSAERVERATKAKYKDRREIKVFDEYEAKSSQVSKVHTSRRGRDHSIEIKRKKRTYHSSEESSTADSMENIGTKGVLSKVYSKKTFSNEKEKRGIHGQKHGRKIDMTSSEESTSSNEGDDDKKHRGRGSSAQGKGVKGSADRKRFSGRIDDGLSSEDESDEDLRRYAKGKMKAGHYERERRNKSDDSYSLSNDGAENLRKEKQRKRKSRLMLEDSSSKDTRKDQSNKLKKSERQSKRSREYVSSTDHKGNENKEDHRNRKKTERESSVDEEQMKDKKVRKGNKRSVSDDEYEVRKSERKQKARMKSDKIGRRKKHSDTRSEESEYERKDLERRHKKHGKHLEEDTGVKEKPESVLEDEAKDGDGVGEQRSARREEMIEEEKGSVNDNLRTGELDRNKDYNDSVASEDVYQKAILSILHETKHASNVDMKIAGHVEEKQGINIVEKEEDDAQKEARIARDSSSDLSLYGDIDLKGVTNQTLINKADFSKTRQASPRRKIPRTAPSGDSQSPIDRAAKKDETDKTVKRRESLKPQYNRRTRSVSRDKDSRRKKQRKVTHASDSGSSYDSTDREGMSARKRPSRTKSPKSHSRYNQKQRSVSQDSLKKSHRRSGERSYKHKNRPTPSSESTSESDDAHEHRKRSNRKRSRSPRQSTSSSSTSSVDEERRRNGAESRKRKGHAVDSKYRRRRRRTRTSSDESRSSVSSIDRRKRRKK